MLNDKQVEKIKVSVKAVANRGDLVSLQFNDDFKDSDLRHMADLLTEVYHEIGIMTIVGRMGQFTLNKVNEKEMNKLGWYRK